MTLCRCGANGWTNTVENEELVLVCDTCQRIYRGDVDPMSGEEAIFETGKLMTTPQPKRHVYHTQLYRVFLIPNSIIDSMVSE